jgi:hypothetical protein
MALGSYRMVVDSLVEEVGSLEGEVDIAMRGEDIDRLEVCHRCLAGDNLSGVERPGEGDIDCIVRLGDSHFGEGQEVGRTLAVHMAADLVVDIRFAVDIPVVGERHTAPVAPVALEDNIPVPAADLDSTTYQLKLIDDGRTIGAICGGGVGVI